MHLPLWTALSGVPSAVDVPDITPDWDAPFISGLISIGSFILAGALIVVLIMLIIAFVGVVTKGGGSERFQSWSGEWILKILAVAAGLGAVNAIFAFAVGFDFGF
ncbi:hypothetical protein E3T43_18045 [Cryobacterium sp. Hh7]|uniref:hypothetical protein n=1 Tax=Cryobacterium sp. Hh7 TaxID=1259159 RepID=UPI00106A521F|nr:hypothetical protein [Cryobacterium sp. Hh7]TFD50735.1 hypothetical protein E3T43_18045 [Cryobacterium sp. Hh7]